MIHLYLKTHRDTGLKYLGKTIKDPHTYEGSGVRWRNHLKKHGNNVVTEILLSSQELEDIREAGLKYSKEWDIVNNPEFANMMEENGQGGENSGSFKKGQAAHNKGKKSPEQSARKKAYWEQWRKDNPNYKDKWKKYEKKGHARVDNTSAMNKTTIQCPYCDKNGNVGNMKRWHFENCKYGPNSKSPR